MYILTNIALVAYSFTEPLFILLDMLLFALLMHIIVTLVDEGTLHIAVNNPYFQNLKPALE